MPRPAFAYLFERFPSFTQTFTVREVQGVIAHGLTPQVYSIRRPEGEPPQDFPREIAQQVHYLPEVDAMRAEIRRLKDEKTLPKQVAKALRELNEAGETADKTRFYEAAWLGLRLREQGIRHVHVHFAGVAARTAWWLRQLYGTTFSFTAHANDFFVKVEHKITLSDLVSSAAFIAHVSEYGLREMAQHFPASTGKMVCIYNGLNLEEYQQAGPAAQSVPAEWLSAGAAPLVLSVGRLIEKKGFADLIAACALLRDRGVPLNCAIAGDGPLRESLEAQIAQLQLKDRVLLLGNQPQAEIRALLERCGIFALACVTEADGGKDNLPTVITEAMAFGRPVVSTTLAGVPEQVAHAETGLLASPGDVAEFAEHLVTLAQDEELRRRYGTAGLARAQELFALEKTTLRLVECLITRGRAIPPFSYAAKHPQHLLKAILHR